MATSPGHPESPRRPRALAVRARRAVELALGRAMAGRLDALQEQITELALAVMARDERLVGLVDQLAARVAGLEHHVHAATEPTGGPGEAGQLAEVRSLLVEIQQHLTGRR